MAMPKRLIASQYISRAPMLAALCCVLLSACASFDRTNIRPGDRVPGPALSFEAPTKQSWFTSEYGSGHRMRLVQLNDLDSYTIEVALNRGPARGMYASAEAHMSALRRHRRFQPRAYGYDEMSRNDAVDERYGKLCVRSTSHAKDWRGRNRAGPALVDKVALSCPHPKLDNVLVSVEITHRYEEDMVVEALAPTADDLFGSLEFHASF